MAEIPEEAVEAAVKSFMDTRVDVPEGEELEMVRQDVREALQAALPALEADWMERLLSNEVARAAQRAWERSPSSAGVRRTWRLQIEAALKEVADDGE